MQITRSLLFNHFDYIYRLKVSLFSVLIPVQAFLFLRAQFFAEDISSKIAVDKLSKRPSKYNKDLLKNVSIRHIGLELLSIFDHMLDDAINVRLIDYSIRFKLGLHF
jgi:hypothetical protein